MPKFYAALFFIVLSYTAHAQATWEIGGTLGGSGYIGDLNPSPFKPGGGSAGAFIKRNFNGYLSARLNYQSGKIAGADSTSSSGQLRNRNLSFTDKLSELSLMAEFNFMKYIPDAGKNKYTPYIYLGIGTTSFSPQTMYNGNEVSLRELRTEGQPAQYKKSNIVIPYGAGIKYNIGGKWTVGAELGYRYTRTDFLDDVSGLYAPHGSLPGPVSVALADRSGERTGNYIGSPGSQRGDSRPRDIYSFFGFTLSYTFVTEKCYYEQ
jgi:opacity protein-like surface antigen